MEYTEARTQAFMYLTFFILEGPRRNQHVLPLLQGLHPFID
jgi:hypothetical protein